MSRKKPQPPTVASTGCYGLVSCSCLSRHRRGLQQLAPRSDDAALPRRNAGATGGDAAEAAERYWKRVQLLEEEIQRLSKRLGHEERPGPPATTTECVVRGRAKDLEEVGGGSAATECVGNGAKAREEGGSVSTGTSTAAKKCASAGHGACCSVQEVVRLEDGSYVREVRRVGRPWPWERLAVQVSAPVVPEDAGSASEVLDKMAAMRAEDLCKFLIRLMPLKNITGQKNPGEPVRRTARLSTGDDLVEALVLRAMDKLESLVLEGLKIQMASPAAEPAAVAAVTADRRRDEAFSKGGMIHVVLMQMRDPKERYGAIGDPMIGLIEASLEKKDDGTVRLEMLGLHVAGISFINRKPSDGRCIMWSAYLRQCKEPHDGNGDGCRCTCVRNPNRVFQR